MKKFYSLVLMAVALLIGTNVWAEGNGVIQLIRKGNTQPETKTYNHLNAAFADAHDGDLLQLTEDMNESIDSTAWLGEPTSGTLENYASTDRSITLDLKGHKYTFTSAKDYCIALTRGELKIQSTGGDGEIISNKGVFVVYGSYLKINAKDTIPFSHLIIDENVTITTGANGGSSYRGVQIECYRPYQATDVWGWKKTPVDLNCDIFYTTQHGISNGARVDIYGKVIADKYAFQISGNVRSAREYLNSDGSYKGNIPQYWAKSSTELYLPGIAKPGDNYGKSITHDNNNFLCYYDNTTNHENDDYVLLATDDSLYSPYVHIHSGAVLKTNHPDSKSSSGFYSSGYARCYIEGTCEGSTGVYVKAGEVELHDATVVSNWTGRYKPAENDSTSSGINSGGSAIVIESKDGWTGNIEVTISGDSHVSTNNGYAIDERVSGRTTDVNYLTITGGTFDGGQVPVEINGTDTTWAQGTMHVSQPTLDAHHNPDTITTITILGAEVKGEANKIGEGDQQVTLADFLAGQTNATHVTYVEVPDPNNPSVTKTTMVISEGSAPSEDPDNVGNTSWEYIASQSNSDNPPSYAWTAIEQNQQISSGTIYLGELQINSGSDGNLQELIIHDGATLQVERLIMNAYARIIVEAGGKLIVNGTQGISAPSTQNIVLESTADKQAYFLFNPAVSSNKNPNASVDVLTECKQTGYNPWTYVYQRIASPLKDTLTAAPANDFIAANLYTADATNTVFESYIYHWDVAQAKWNTGLWTEMAPFTGYQLANNSLNGGVTYTFSGKLVGNQDGDYRFASKGFDFFGNSYTAPIYIDSIFAHFNNAGVQAAIWIYDYAGGNYIAITPEDFDGTGFPQWLNGSPLKEIAPFAGFIMKLDDDAAGKVAKLNYAAAIWGNPDVNPSAAAPARHSQETADRVTLRVDAANGNADMIKFIQSDRFTEAFDNGADASKYFSENGVNLYAVTNDGELAHVATNDLENTVLAFQAGNATEYTISVPAQSGETFMLRDLVTNQTMLMTAGATYAFNQEAYSTNNARFEIVKAPQATTAIENTEAVKNVKGIYTITGQYVGENFEILPAGVYVVNGVKIVK